MAETDKLRYINVLKFIAIMMVFLSHCFKEPYWLNQDVGKIGAFTFVLVSAYGLTKSYQNRELKVGDYVKRRLLRLFPLYLVTLAIVVGISVMIKKVVWGGWHQTLNLITHIFGIHGFFPDYIWAYNGPLWFITLILQFYLIFPLLLKLMKKGLLVPLFLVSLIINFLSQHYWPLQKITHGLINMNGEPGVLKVLPIFLIGMYLATQDFDKQKVLSSLKTAIVLAMLFLFEVNRHRSFFAVLTFLFVALASGILKFNVMAKLGTYSFGFYLLHYPFLGLLKELFLEKVVNNPLLFIVAYGAVVYAISALIEGGINALVKRVRTKK